MNHSKKKKNLLQTPLCTDNHQRKEKGKKKKNLANITQETQTDSPSFTCTTHDPASAQPTLISQSSSINPNPAAPLPLHPFHFNSL